MQRNQPSDHATLWSVTHYQPRNNRLAAALRRIFDCPLRRGVYRLTMAIFFWFATDALDIAGSSTAADNTAHDAIMHLLSPDADAVGDGDVTVVLWTEAAAQAFVREGLAERRWPIEYRAHADLLFSLIDYNPAVIFLDFAFLEWRPDEGFEDLEEALIYASSQGVPVLISWVPEAGEPAFSRLVDLVSRLDGIDFVPATISSEAVVRHYPLRIAAGHDGQELSAAVQATNRLRSHRGLRELRFRSSQSDLALLWYRTVHPATDVYFGDETPTSEWCEARAGSLAAVGVPHAAKLHAACTAVHAWFLDHELAQRPLAAPPILPADAVRFEETGPTSPPACHDGRRVGGTRPETPIAERSLADLLACRAVMIGSGLLAAGDVRDTPIAKRQPSVLIHAQATQNLVDQNAFFTNPLVVDGPLTVVADWMPWLEDLGAATIAAVAFLVLTVPVYSIVVEAQAAGHLGAGTDNVLRGPFALLADLESSLLLRMTIVLGWSLVVGAVLAFLLIEARVDPTGWGSAFLALVLLELPIALPAANQLLLRLMYRRSSVDGIRCRSFS